MSSIKPKRNDYEKVEDVEDEDVPKKQAGNSSSISSGGGSKSINSSTNVSMGGGGLADNLTVDDDGIIPVASGATTALAQDYHYHSDTSQGSFEGKDASKLELFGIDIAGMKEHNLMILLTVGALGCSLGFAFLQEKVFLVPGFEFSGFMTFLTLVTYMFAAMLERYVTNDRVRKGSLTEYAQLSVFTMGGAYLTNWSLTYLNYPTRVMFKSSKVIPVMLAGMVIQNRRYSPLEYASAGVLVAGITVFTLGDAKESPRFDPRGIVLICLGVLFDAITSNFEEKRFFRAKACSQAEVMFFSSLFGLIWSLGSILGNGELVAAMQHASIHPEVIVWTVTFALLGYCSVIFILLLIKRFGATNAEIVKSCRKVLSIVISFVVFSKPISPMHVLGGFLFTASIALAVFVKSGGKKKSQVHSPVGDDVGGSGASSNPQHHLYPKHTPHYRSGPTTTKR